MEVFMKSIIWQFSKLYSIGNMQLAFSGIAKCIGNRMASITYLSLSRTGYVLLHFLYNFSFSKALKMIDAFCPDLTILKKAHLGTVLNVQYFMVGGQESLGHIEIQKYLISPPVGKHLFLCNSKRLLKIQGYKDFRNSKGTCFQTAFMRH